MQCRPRGESAFYFRIQGEPYCALVPLFVPLTWASLDQYPVSPCFWSANSQQDPTKPTRGEPHQPTSRGLSRRICIIFSTDGADVECWLWPRAWALFVGVHHLLTAGSLVIVLPPSFVPWKHHALPHSSFPPRLRCHSRRRCASTKPRVAEPHPRVKKKKKQGLVPRDPLPAARVDHCQTSQTTANVIVYPLQATRTRCWTRQSATANLLRTHAPVARLVEA